MVISLYSGLLFLSQLRAANSISGRTFLWYTWPLNCSFLFSFNAMIPDASGARGRTLQVLSHSTGTLQIAP